MRTATLRSHIRLIVPILAAAAAIAVAPAASAETHLQCTNPSANNTQCETPGNVQLNSSPGVVTYQQPYPYLYGPVIGFGLGGHGIGGGHGLGGGHGMGGHH